VARLQYSKFNNMDQQHKAQAAQESFYGER
jgi:hypothetical protein